MRTIKLENGKEVEISEESYKALAESINNKEYLIPLNVAGIDDGIFYLKNLEGNNMISIVNDNLKCGYKLHTNQVKMVDVNNIEDIKVGDLIRCTDKDNWENEENEKDKCLRLIYRIRDGEIYYYYWNGNILKNSGFNFYGWKHWQVSKEVK